MFTKLSFLKIGANNTIDLEQILVRLLELVNLVCCMMRQLNQFTERMRYRRKETQVRFGGDVV